MADYDSNRIVRGQAAEAGVIDAGLRAYMLRVYNYMGLGLGLTGLTSYATYMLAVTNDPALTVERIRARQVAFRLPGGTKFKPSSRWAWN